MQERLQFYIDGQWIDPAVARSITVINPSTEAAFARISLGSKADVDKAVVAARRAFESFSRTSREERLALLQRIIKVYQKRYGEIADAISMEMGAPTKLAHTAQAAAGLAHLGEMVKILKDFSFIRMRGPTAIVQEPIGVCGLITPWNWPMNQIACKVAPALGAGCTMILKPSEIAPMSALLFAEVLDEAGTPPGVFNLINGDGAGVGEAMSAHPGIDMMSFTGSTRAGIAVARGAASTVKRVTQELGGKSPNIILDDADLERAVGHGVAACFNNSGQSCNAPTRMFVSRGRQEQAIVLAAAAAAKAKPGDPFAEGTTMGPLVSQAQFDKVQALIQKGMDEGARLVTGGLGRPDGLNRGYFVRPTIFADVANDMTIAREEIFGPVLCILPYDSEADAIRMANDTVYGLSSYVQAGDLEHARRVALQIRAGNVLINDAPRDFGAPFGGYKQSGNGREWGDFGLAEYLETKTVMGFGEKSA
jgi:aldehyde dehydrogenase (NAD+)